MFCIAQQPACMFRIVAQIVIGFTNPDIIISVLLIPRNYPSVLLLFVVRLCLLGAKL